MTEKVLVGGLSGKAWNVARLKDAFIPFGPMQDLTLGQEGRAVIVFKHSEDAAEAVDNMDGAVLEQCIVSAQLAKSNTEAAGTTSLVASGSRYAVWEKKNRSDDLDANDN